MGFLEIKKDIHSYCRKPTPDYGIGTRWQCDECGQIWVISTFMEYNQTYKGWEREQ